MKYIHNIDLQFELWHGKDDLVGNFSISWDYDISSNQNWTRIQRATSNKYYNCSTPDEAHAIYKKRMSINDIVLDFDASSSQWIEFRWIISNLGTNGIFGWYKHTIAYWPVSHTMLFSSNEGGTKWSDDDLSSSEWSGNSTQIVNDKYHGWYFDASNMLQRTFWMNTFYSKILTISFNIYVGCMSCRDAADSIQVCFCFAIFSYVLYTSFCFVCRVFLK